MTRRIRVHVSVGDVLQLIGVVGACLAVGHLAGLWWGVLLGAVYVIVDANLSYGARHLTIPLLARRDFQMLKATVQKPFVRAHFRARAAWLRAHR